MSDVVAMMSPDTTTKTKAQEIHRPSEVTAPQQMSSPSNARNMITDPSDTYLALLNKTMNVAPNVMRKLRDLLDREVERHDHE